jgi:hypothetical protein
MVERKVIPTLKTIALRRSQQQMGRAKVVDNLRPHLWIVHLTLHIVLEHARMTYSVCGYS